MAATLRRGEHTIKFGGQLNFIQLNRKVTNFTNPSFFYFNPGPTGNFDQLTQQPEAAFRRAALCRGPDQLVDTQPVLRRSHAAQRRV